MMATAEVVIQQVKVNIRVNERGRTKERDRGVKICTNG
jgi:hypothetical protein